MLWPMELLGLIAAALALAVTGPIAALAAEESVPAASAQPLRMALASSGPGVPSSSSSSGRPLKRAYTYVSEYKRLPLYNFGVGKREAMVKRGRDYSFGVGKRTHKFNFGVGKRTLGEYDSSYEDYLRSILANEVLERYVEARLRQQQQQQYKRSSKSQLYSFGVGKRDAGGGDLGNNDVEPLMNDEGSFYSSGASGSGSRDDSYYYLPNQQLGAPANKFYEENFDDEE